MIIIIIITEISLARAQLSREAGPVKKLGTFLPGEVAGKIPLSCREDFLIRCKMVQRIKFGHFVNLEAACGLGLTACMGVHLRQDISYVQFKQQLKTFMFATN